MKELFVGCVVLVVLALLVVALGLCVQAIVPQEEFASAVALGLLAMMVSGLVLLLAFTIGDVVVSVWNGDR